MASSIAGKIWSPLYSGVTWFPATSGAPKSVLMARANWGSPTANDDRIGFSTLCPPDVTFTPTMTTNAVATEQTAATNAVRAVGRAGASVTGDLASSKAQDASAKGDVQPQVGMVLKRPLVTAW